jgi:rod shape-determining protein MreD
MTRSIIWTTGLCIAVVILQSTLIAKISFFNVIPDIALCILVFSAYVNGTMTGQISGFFSGLFYDFLSAAPLGMSCLIRTLIGALTGLFRGSFFLDPVFLPVILCIIATILKAVIVNILHLFMGDVIPSNSFLSLNLWIEVGFNAVCAPLLFLILKHFKPIIVGRN